MHMSSVRTIEDDGQVSGKIHVHDCTVFLFFFLFLTSIKGSWFLIKKLSTHGMYIVHNYYTGSPGDGSL